MSREEDEVKAVWKKNNDLLLESTEEMTKELPLLAPFWRQLREKVEVRHDSSLNNLTETNDLKARIQGLQNIALDLQIAKDFNSLFNAVRSELEKMSRKNTGEGLRLLNRAEKILMDIAAYHTPTWLYGPGLELKGFTHPLPASWQSLQAAALFPIEVFQQAFVSKGKQPLSLEEYQFLTECLVRICEREENYSYWSLLDEVIPYLLDINLSTFQEIFKQMISDEIPPLRHTKTGKKFHMGTAEIHFMKSFSSYFEEVFGAIKKPGDEKHAAARWLLETLEQMYQQRQTYDFPKVLTVSLANREMANTENGIVNVLNSLLDYVEETNDPWYHDFIQKILDTARGLNHGPELLLSACAKVLKIPAESLEQLEAKLQTTWEKYWQTVGEFSEKEIHLEDELLNRLSENFLPGNKTTLFRSQLELNPPTFLISIEFINVEGMAKKISFMLEITKDKKPQFVLQVLAIDFDEESETYENVHKALVKLATDLLQETVKKQQETAKRGNGQPQVVSVAKKKGVAVSVSSKKRARSNKNSAEEDVVSPSLRREYEAKLVRPEMILPREVLQELPPGMTADYLTSKIELYNQGLLSLRKIVSYQSKDGFDLYRLKIGRRHRVIAELREDGRLYVVGVYARKEDTYKE